MTIKAFSEHTKKRTTASTSDKLISDTEDETEYDKLPPFRHLRKSQLDKLSKAQRKAYFDELEYRKNFMKKQLKEERPRRFMKKMPGLQGGS
jgi:hypothetical protein